MTEPVASPRRNRVDPWSDLHAHPARGVFTGNRGCVVDDAERVVRHHGSQLWIICRLDFNGWRWPLARPRRWTPLFFLDDAVGLAAGHRPCATCRRDDYRSYREAVTAALGAPAPLCAHELNRRLHTERHRPGRGLERRSDRIVATMPSDEVPTGTVCIDSSRCARLVVNDAWLRFDFAGWADPAPFPVGRVEVLTPPTSVLALRHGYRPVLHPSATHALDSQVG